jgi:ATP-dependent Lhr-like helicase
MTATADGRALIEGWFATRKQTPFAFQRESWDAYQRGQSGLIHASTGTGKTYAAWLGPLIDWIDAHRDSQNRWASMKPPPLHVLWITPLRALVADTEEALRRPLDEIGIPWSVQSRTSDTPTSARNKQRTRLPTALVTTPESLWLLLSYPDAATLFKELRAVIVDEWHELAATKRGVQVELGLARLRGWQPNLRVWGLSATLGNLDTALQVLLGVDPQHKEAGTLIKADIPKALTVKSIIPPVIERFPWAGHLGTNLLPQVVGVIESGRSALLFTNTRAQAELWYQALLEARPDWAGIIALHHSALDRATRTWVENGLRTGDLLCVVCTSSLDLGVDFTPVDQVIEIGSPKGVARLLQRAGRSGHQPGAESAITCVPTHAFELVEIAAARAAIAARQVEPRVPIEGPLDVLAQYAVTIAVGGGFTPDALRREVQTAYAYRNLRDDAWAWVLDFITRGGQALQNYPEYARVTVGADGRYSVKDKTVAQMHRMSIGTIVADAWLAVQYLSGGRLGQVEESFVARLRPGDRFIFAGKVLEFVRLREMIVWVRRATRKTRIVPRWSGSRMSFSGELAQAVRMALDEARRGHFPGTEMEAVRPIMELQARWSQIPALEELLIECTKTRDGYHLFFFPFEGRAVHEGLAALFAYRMGRSHPMTFNIAVNDYGFELLSPDPIPLQAAIAGGLFAPEGLLADIDASLNASELARRQFREIARIAGLVFQGYPGRSKTTKQLQASSGLLYDVFARYDPGNQLLIQAHTEVMERQLENSRLAHALARFRTDRLVIVDAPRLTPFAFPLVVEGFRDTMSFEALEDRIHKMQLQLEQAADKPARKARARQQT